MTRSKFKISSGACFHYKRRKFVEEWRWCCKQECLLKQSEKKGSEKHYGCWGINTKQEKALSKAIAMEKKNPKGFWDDLLKQINTGVAVYFYQRSNINKGIK